ncbi:hypothetical protein V6U90_00610 [Micromonospora sp. CPCC 206060]|uniref:hypothetical protein n=1 Tax=Micromonospora sp. CPCC 206060 TaxID=3122406 RepID=UPI002FF166A0
MGDRELYCDGCDADMPFEMPPCQDGHGDDCPELVCTGCGAALLIATFPPVRTARSTLRRGDAVRRHRAA